MNMITKTASETPVSEPVLSGNHPANPVRYHYLDNLRAIALLAGVLFHVGFGFNVITAGVWPTANTETSMIFDYWTYFLHTFRMPLFFLIAGFFAHYLVQKRGAGGFLKNRALRIALPFIVFWPLLAASIIGVFFYAATSMDVDTPVIQMIRLAMSNPEAMNGQKPPVSTTHLWFIYYLSIFCFATAVVVRWMPEWKNFYWLLSNPWVLIVGLPAVTFVTIARIFVPHPAPESFMPAPWALAFFGLFFIVGWVFFARKEMLSQIAGRWPYLAASSVVATLALMMNLPAPITMETATQFQQAQALSMEQILRVSAASVLAWHMTFLSLIAGKKLLDKKNNFLRYVADGSYWVYIMHLPVVFYLQLLFHSIDLPIWIEFFVISALTLGAGYLSYALLVRHTPIGWLLNGRRRKPGNPTGRVIGDTLVQP